MGKDKEHSQLVVIISLKNELERCQKLIISYKNWIQRGMLVIVLMAVGMLAFAFMAFSSDSAYFAVDPFGGYSQVQAYDEPNLSREMRLQHAEHIVRALNSLDFIGYKDSLATLEGYFMPATWNGYIQAMEAEGLFERIEMRNLKYTPSINPPRIIANNSKGTVYSDPACYQTIRLEDGSEISADCSATSIEAGGHTETYEFSVKRDLYSNARQVESKTFRVRLTLTKQDNGARKNGYVVTRYEEIY